MLLPSGRLSITVLSLSEEPLLKQLIEQVPRTCLLEHLHGSSSCPEKQRCSPWGNPALWSQQGGLRSSRAYFYCRERNHPWSTLYYCSIYWLAKIFAEIAVARVGFIAQSHALGPWGNGEADIPCKCPWVCCKLSRAGREGITPEQQYLNGSAGQCLVWVCKTQHLYTRTTHPRWLACCRDGKQIFIVESKKAALGMPHFEVTFIPQTAGRAARGKSSPILLGRGGRCCTLTHTAWCFIHRHNQVHSTRPGLTSSRSSAHLAQRRTNLLQTLFLSPLRIPLFQWGAHPTQPQHMRPSQLQHPCSPCQGSSQALLPLYSLSHYAASIN